MSARRLSLLLVPVLILAAAAAGFWAVARRCAGGERPAAAGSGAEVAEGLVPTVACVVAPPAETGPSTVGETLEQIRLQTKAKDAAVRLEAARALGPFGTSALPELTELITDPDAAVRREALQRWRAAVVRVPDETKRSRMIQSCLSVTDDASTIRELLDLLTALPKPLAAQSLAAVIGGPNPNAVEAARAAYGRLTKGGADVPNPAGAAQKQ